MIQGDSFVMYDSLPTLPALYNNAQSSVIQPSVTKSKFKTPKLSNLFATLGMGWNKKSGLSIGGKNIGKFAPLLQAGMSGLQTLQGLSDISNANTDYNTLKSDILSEAMSNPLASYDLTTEQNDLLYDLKKGRDTTTADIDDVLNGIGSDLPNTALQALIGGLIGGIPGAVIGGVGNLVNSGVAGYAQGQQEQFSQLQNLYNTLMQSGNNYRSMLRPNLSRLGITRGE